MADALDQIQKLRQLQTEAADPETLFRDKRGRAAWRADVITAVSEALGNRHLITMSMRKVKITASGTDKTASDLFVEKVEELCQLTDEAIAELEFSILEIPVGEHSFDPALWNHVKDHVKAGKWHKVVSRTTEFVEDRIRVWSEMDEADYEEALGDSGELRLGEKRAEWEGWRGIAAGLDQAVSSVDSSRLQSREDARRYAVGVLGMSSLLLTQLRFQHGFLIEERESKSTTESE